MKQVLVTGGLGFIGSHTVVELINEGYEPVILDDLSNSKVTVCDRIEKITGKSTVFIKGSISDRNILNMIFSEYDIDHVIHFAGLKAVGESVREPLRYFETNVGGSVVLFSAMKEHGVKSIVFSSSATVYGVPERIPLDETCKGSPTNPYGATKALIERLLSDLYRNDEGWNITILRYFNPIGAHESGLIGEDPNGIPNNLIPYIAKVACGKLEKIHVFGNDYPTPDGTGIRDYIHVVDLAKGHIAALKAMEKSTGLQFINLGTGKGYSVLDVIKAYSKACGTDLPYVIEGRRSGDIASYYSDPSKAFEVLGWKAEFGIEKMCEDSYNWQSKNPNGYDQ